MDISANSESEIDDSEHDEDFQVKQLELNSFDSDEISLAEARRRRKSKRSASSKIPLSTINPDGDSARPRNADGAQTYEPSLQGQEPGPFQEEGTNVSVPSTSTNETFLAATVSPQGQTSQQPSPTDPDDISLPEVRRLEQAMRSSSPTISHDEISQQQGSSQGTSKERGRSRKRTRNEKSWKKNVIKSMRYSGQEYTSEKGKQFSARRVKSPCPASSPRKCTTLFTEADRKGMFDRFWALGNKKDQSTFVATAVEKCAITRATRDAKIKRDGPFKYFFLKGDTKIQVCRMFFLNTLDLKKDYVMGTVRRKQRCGVKKAREQEEVVGPGD